MSNLQCVLPGGLTGIGKGALCYQEVGITNFSVEYISLTSSPGITEKSLKPIFRGLPGSF